MRAAETTRRSDRPWPGRAGDEVAIALLRDLDPARLILYGGRQPDRREWERHRGQHSAYVLVATRGDGATRRVAGTLEFRVAAGERGAQGLLDRLYVDRGHRRRGIASHLLRAAIAFARDRGLAALRESIPAVLIRDPASGLWLPNTPAGEGWGGLRSLGATANACVQERQPCAVARALRATRRPLSGRADEKIGAILILPLARAGSRAVPEGGVGAGAALRERLILDLAAAAGVGLANPAEGRAAAGAPSGYSPRPPRGGPRPGRGNPGPDTAAV